MEYGFVIDQRRCIGCHACTVACKSENDVPVGDFRTWVKYTEKGAFPDVRRHFTVLRCNHCDAAPCVEICPVVALHKRPDAIVDLDRDVCIGCRACMQACPYDALYLNADTGTAEKCHYCAHRTELGLEPACVVVCPEEAIVAGEVDNPEHRIARIIKEEKTSRRKLDKGTQPRVWYVDALEDSLVPGQAQEPDAWLWSDRRRPPLSVPGFEAMPDLKTTLNVDHPPVWGWHIWTYLMTKNISAGAMIVAPFLGLLGIADGSWPELVSLLMLGITGFLLVHDLGRPERFLNILFHPNPKSWLVIGTWILMVFGALTTASLIGQWTDQISLSHWARWLNLPFAVMASGYSAFLFAQCRGRDLWLEKGLFGHLIVRAGFLGSLLLITIPSWKDSDTRVGLAFTCALGLLTAAGMYAGKVKPPHTKDGQKAATIMYSNPKVSQAIGWMVACNLGFAVLLVLQLAGALIPTGIVWAVYPILVLVACWSLFEFERAWIRSGQEVPLS